MKNKRSLSKINCIRSSSSCITWEGPEIKCLDICTGDELEDLIYSLAQKVCSSLGESDFSTLSLQCLIDKLHVTLPVDRSLINLLQLSFDNDCKLKDLIDKLEAKIVDPNLPLNLDMKCLTVVDGFGVPMPVTQLVLDQVLINQFCALKNKINALEAKDISLQSQIDSLNVNPYVEPTISTCWVGTRSLSQQVVVGYQSICDYRNKVGIDIDIQAALSQQPANLNPVYASNPNWKITPSSLAMTDVNQWIVIKNLMGRIAALEDCACKITCKDVLIGFNVTFNEDKTATLKFTTGAGTNLPTGFIDCGSLLTITNDKGISNSGIPIVITQDGIIDDIDISSFEPGEYLTFSLEAAMCSPSLHCQKCITKTVKNTSGCCLITNDGTEKITITYQTCGLPVQTTGPTV